MTIVDAEGDIDFSQFVGLLRALWPPEFGQASDHDLLADMERSYDPSVDAVKLLRNGDHIIGFGRYSLWPRNEQHPTMAHIMDLVVRKDYQHHGFGRKLMETMIQECKQRNLHPIFSRTLCTNNPIVGLHRVLGFQEFRRANDWILWRLET